MVKETLPRGLVNKGSLITRRLTSNGQTLWVAAWSRVINDDVCGFIGETTVFFKTQLQTEKALASASALFLVDKQGGELWALVRAPLGSVREKSPHGRTATVPPRGGSGRVARLQGGILRELSKRWGLLVKVIGLRVRQTWATDTNQSSTRLYLSTPRSPVVQGGPWGPTHRWMLPPRN